MKNYINIELDLDQALKDHADNPKTQAEDLVELMSTLVDAINKRQGCPSGKELLKEFATDISTATLSADEIGEIYSNLVSML